MSADEIKKWKGIFKSNIEIFSPEERKIGEALAAAGQASMFSKWRNPGQKDAEKKQMLQALSDVHFSYNGGISGYVKKAQSLFKNIKKNPFSSFSPSPVEGTIINETEEDMAKKDDFEMKGAEDAGKIAFVLLGGGVTDNIGCCDAKVSLPVDTCTDTTFLQFYIQNILALQDYANSTGNSDSPVHLPLAIMTSDDTDEQVRTLLDENANYGMENDDILIAKQFNVPCFRDLKSNFATDPKDPFVIDTKPRGHGDVHGLLFSSGIMDKWAKNGIRWIVFIPDTNVLVFNTILAAIGSCIEQNLAMTHVCVPRKPGEPMNAVCKMTSKKTPDTSFVGSIEPNFLEEVLKKDPAGPGGYSAYPNNTKTLVISFSAYNEALEKTQGIMPEYIIPKWKDNTKQTFRVSPRTVCLVQDISRFIEGKTSYIVFPKYLCFAPIKNTTADAKEIQKSGGDDKSAATSEFSRYYFYRQLIRSVGVDVEEAKDLNIQNCQVKNGARIVLSPSFGITEAQIRSKFQATEDNPIIISPRSTLILDGEGITVGGLDLDGTLVVKAAKGAKVHIDNLTVRNKGWEIAVMKVPKQSGQKKPKKSKYPENIVMRGFRMNKLEQFEICYDKPGYYELFKETQRGRPVTNEETQDNEEVKQEPDTARSITSARSTAE